MDSRESGDMMRLPIPFLALAAVYFAASAAHFAHNAEFMAFYPGMPPWITRETTYLAWLGATAVGLFGLVFARLALPSVALLFLGMYGALGLDGLLHYTLALCSEHTFVANLTIWSEASTGLALALAAAVLFVRRFKPAPA